MTADPTPQVSFVQAALNHIWAASPLPSVDGDYGPKTIAAGSLTSPQSNWLGPGRAARTATRTLAP